MRVVRFYVSCPASSFSFSSAGPQLQALDLDRSVPGPEQQAQDQSDPRRTSTASTRSQGSLPDPNSNLWIKVFPAGPPPQAPDQSIPRRTSTANSGSTFSPWTSTASSGSECSLPDLNHRESPKIYQIESQKECQKNMPDRMPEKCQNICQNNGSGWGSLEERNFISMEITC